MRYSKELKCYVCCKPSTSKEHVPPLCLFPEKKDLNFSNFRKELIKVPSCELHNSKKSKDDEFLMIALASIYGVNDIGILHLATKVNRAIKRKGLQDFNEIIQKTSDQKPNDKNDILPIVNIGHSDYDRFVNCFKHIAYGLYYHKFKNVFDGEVIILIDFINYHDENFNKWKILCRDQFELELKDIPEEGHNQEIFSYSFTLPDNFDMIAVRMTYYSEATVFAIFKSKELVLPKNISLDFIKSEIKTLIRGEDGKFYEFN